MKPVVFCPGRAKNIDKRLQTFKLTGYKVTMQKPTFPTVVKISPEEIRVIRAFYRKSREEFARFFPVTGSAIKSWETGFRNPYGPAAVRLQELKAYADHVKAEKEAVLKKILKRNTNV